MKSSHPLSERRTWLTPCCLFVVFLPSRLCVRCGSGSTLQQPHAVTVKQSERTSERRGRGDSIFVAAAQQRRDRDAFVRIRPRLPTHDGTLSLFLSLDRRWVTLDHIHSREWVFLSFLHVAAVERLVSSLRECAFFIVSMEAWFSSRGISG